MGDLAFRDAGDPDAPVALLLHGYPNSSYLWKDCLQPIADAGWRAVAPDLPGFGDSEPFDGDAGTWSDHVDALDDFVARHALAPLALVVHDWGGQVALTALAEQPERFSALVLLDTRFNFGESLASYPPAYRAAFTAWLNFLATTPDLEVGPISESQT